MYYNKNYQNHGYKKRNPEDLGQHTLISQARSKVNGFADQMDKFEKKLSVLGRSQSTFLNYSRHLAKMSLHYDCLPTTLDEDQITDYLHLLQQEHNTPSDSYFKHTVYGLRMLCKVEGLIASEIGLPSIKKQSLKACPICKTGKMHIIMMFGIRGPPCFTQAGDKNKRNAGV